MADEAQQDPMLGFPCDGCSAGVGEPCEDNCPYGDETWAAITAQAHEERFLPDPDYEDAYAVPSAEESWAKLTGALHRLPFGALAGHCPERSYYDPDEFLARLASYVSSYEQVSREMIEELQSQAKRAMVLQFEKDSARAWMGVA